MFLPSIYDFCSYFLFETYNKQLFFYLVMLPSNSHHAALTFSVADSNIKVHFPTGYQADQTLPLDSPKKKNSWIGLFFPLHHGFFPGE